MGWIQRLFSKTPDDRVVVFETGESRADQAVCVKLDGAHIIDLRPLPPDRERALGAIKEVTATIEKSPQPIQVWVASNRLLEAYAGDTQGLRALTDALFKATKRAQPKMIVENDAPAGVVYLLRSLGFEVFLQNLRLMAVDSKGRAKEIDVMKELAKLRNAARLRV
jgi:hypothetical protein